MAVYDQTCRARNTAVDANVQRWNGIRRICAGISLGFEHLDMPFLCHSDEEENMHGLSYWLQKGIDVWMLDVACCFLCEPANKYHLVHDAEK